jgi:hypothetical protein
LTAVKEKGGLNDPPFFHIIAAVIEGNLFSFSGLNHAAGEWRDLAA